MKGGIEMEILLTKGPREIPQRVTVDGPLTGEELLQRFGEGLPYDILAVRVNQQVKELAVTIDGDCSVEFLDMRTHSANLIYQRSLSLIYLKAIEDVLGRVTVLIENTLNKGLFTELKMPVVITDEQLAAVSARMQELIDGDLPINKVIVSREEAMERLRDMGAVKKAELLQWHPELDNVVLYELEGYENFFYGAMVPSTGYIKRFELKKYHRGVILRFPYPTKPDEIPEFVDETKLCSAFGESKKWHNLLDVAFLSDLNRTVVDGRYKEIVLLSEALHEKKIAEIADEICSSGKRIVLIAGPSSSGKTTFARRLCIQLMVNGKKPLYLGTDDYFVERGHTPLDENDEPDYEALGAVDIGMFNEHMNRLLEGNEVDIPSFDFIEGKKVFGGRITSVGKDQPIVIEGIHALNGELTKYIDDEWKYKIYISPFVQLNMDNHNRIATTDARMIRRMVRDNRYRGKSAAMTIKEWPKVRRGEDKYIFPFNGEADVLFNSALAYEMCILKKYAQPLLDEIGPDEPEYSEAQRLKMMLYLVEGYEDDSIVPNNSILQEFIGGSIFVE
jgi:uridine kinase